MFSPEDVDRLLRETLSVITLIDRNGVCAINLNSTRNRYGKEDKYDVIFIWLHLSQNYLQP